MTCMLLIILFNNQLKWFFVVIYEKASAHDSRAWLESECGHDLHAGGRPLRCHWKVARWLPWIIHTTRGCSMRAMRIGSRHCVCDSAPSISAGKISHTIKQTAASSESRSKHGNYNAWLYEIGFKRYDIITAFDPDHVPQPCYSLPGTRVFRRSVRGVRAGCPSLLQPKRQFHRRAAEETYAYYSTIQMASYGMGYPVVIGCHNTHRVTALQEWWLLTCRR